MDRDINKQIKDQVAMLSIMGYLKNDTARVVFEEELRNAIHLTWMEPKHKVIMKTERVFDGHPVEYLFAFKVDPESETLDLLSLKVSLPGKGSIMLDDTHLRTLPFAVEAFDLAKEKASMEGKRRSSNRTIRPDNNRRKGLH